MSSSRPAPVRAKSGRAAIRWIETFLALTWDLLAANLATLVLAGLIVLGEEALPVPLAALRLALGIPFALILPGYLLQAALFPGAEELDRTERAALSFGLSLAVIPLVALILDRLPWGIRLWPIVAALGLTNFLLSLGAAYRRWRLAPGERRVGSIAAAAGGWWAAQDWATRILYGLLSLALATAAFSAAAILLTPKPAEKFTEFYLLGPEGLAESYPRAGRVGERLQVTAGVTNQEGREAVYRIEVRQGEAVIGGTGEFTLADRATIEAPLQFTPNTANPDAQIEFWLYRDGGGEPYRRLRLWMDIRE